MRIMNREEYAIKHAKRLVQIINESAEIAGKTKNSDTKLSRLNLAIKHLFAVKDLANQYPSIKLQQLDLLDFQLTKMKYDYLKKIFGD